MTPFDEPISRWEERLAAAAHRLDYPATPDIARPVRARLDGVKAVRAGFGGMRLARAALIGLIILAALMAVPGVRAAVLDFIRVGAVRVFLATPAPTPGGPAATPTATPLSESAQPGVEMPLTATPFGPGAVDTPAATFSLGDLDGETTLDDARARAGFPVLLPGYPPDLGAPDRVYLQHLDGNVVVMVWMDTKQPDHIRMSLHALGQGVTAFKMGGPVVTELQINSQYAVWAEGPYLLAYRNGDTQMLRMIDGHVLIWTVGAVTYRLETNLTLDEAVKVAESLR